MLTHIDKQNITQSCHSGHPPLQPRVNHPARKWSLLCVFWVPYLTFDIGCCVCFFESSHPFPSYPACFSYYINHNTWRGKRKIVNFSLREMEGRNRMSTKDRVGCGGSVDDWGPRMSHDLCPVFTLIRIAWILGNFPQKASSLFYCPPSMQDLIITRQYYPLCPKGFMQHQRL